MKKVRFLALLLAVMMMGTLALAETADDPVVIKVGETTILLSEAQAYFDTNYTDYAALYAENGMAFSPEDLISLRDAIVDQLAQKAVLDNQIAKLGLNEVSEEDKAAFRAQVDEQFEADLITYAEAVGLSVDEARESVAAEGITSDYLYEVNLENLPYLKLQEQVTDSVTVSDEDVAAEYATYVAEDQSMYENDIASYEMSMMYYGSQDTYYKPEGYRYIKHILLAMPDDISAEMKDIEADMTAAQEVIDALNTELYALENPTEGEETAAEARTVEEVNAEIEAQQAIYDELSEKFDASKEQILPTVQPTVDEIKQKLEGGTSFEDLIAEYNTDPGMESNPDGYEVHKDSIVWDTNFRDAAMALANIGDVSDPVISDFGVHIIYYAGDMPGGAVEMSDEAAETVKADLLAYMKEEAYYTAFEGWINESEIETHPELIVLPELTTETEATGEEAPSTEEDAVPSEDENEDGSIG